MRHNVQVSILDWNSKLLTTVLPPKSTNVKTKFVRYHAFEDQEKRLEMAKEFIEVKFSKSQAVIDDLKLKYSEIKFDVLYERTKLRDVKSIRKILKIKRHDGSSGNTRLFVRFFRKVQDNLFLVL
nr:CRISPR-associated endonuclease Cas1 [Methanosarcina acetivorans]